MTTKDGLADELRADLVDLILKVGRTVHVAPSDDPDFLRLTQLEGLTMQYIDRHPGSSASELADAVSLRSSNASKALRDLEAKGMIRREADAHDKRAVRIWPTAHAERNLIRTRAHWARLLAGVGDAAALRTAIAVLSDADAVLGEQRTEARAERRESAP